MKPLLEIACFNVPDALKAQAIGASRIEFCTSYNDGGLSPDPEVLKQLLTALHISVAVMLRIRPGNFVYSNHEHNAHLNLLKHYMDLGIQTFVFGALNANGSINEKQTESILKNCNNLNLVFHRAIDHCSHYTAGITYLAKTGIHRVLTSGCAKTAVEGIEVLLKLKTMFQSQIEIMPGGGIRALHWHSHFKDQSFVALHSACWNIKTQCMDTTELKAFIQNINA